MGRRVLVGLFAACFALAACGSDGDSAETPTEGGVTIETQADFSDRPVQGTFEVTEGAEVMPPCPGVPGFPDISRILPAELRGVPTLCRRV